MSEPVSYSCMIGSWATPMVGISVDDVAFRAALQWGAWISPGHQGDVLVEVSDGHVTVARTVRLGNLPTNDGHRISWAVEDAHGHDC